MILTVSNSSPLICLSAIGLLDLLPALYGTIHIPDAVYDEVVLNGAGRAGAQNIARVSWITRHTLTDQRAVIEFRNQTKLQQGESEAILLALELGASTIILDDASARKAAIAHQLAVIGTIGVLLVAKGRQLIPSIKQTMDNLKAVGAYIHPDLYYEVLRRAGE